MRESRTEEEGVQIIYRARCSDHQSHQDSMDEFVERSSEERRQQREEQRQELEEHREDSEEQ